jgi:CRISPR-associated endonuclease/helicase Cas3
VFCTATQPSLKPEWLDSENLEEITSDTGALFTALKRTEIARLGYLPDAGLAERLKTHHQALCIVNTRGHAQRLFDLVKGDDGGPGVYHLSTLMYPEHRRAVLREIKARLGNNERCVVVSTQLIEAGVDVDFPCVYRALAGIDSIAQAAGRCNREGELTDENGVPIQGQVFVFEPENGQPVGSFQRLAKLGEEVMDEYADILRPEAVKRFFDLRYKFGEDLDKKHILRDITDGVGASSFQFKDIERNYKVIEDPKLSVVIPRDENCRKLIDQMLKSQFPASFMRRLQRYSVSVYGCELDVLKNAGKIVEPIPELYILDGDEDFGKIYDERKGLVTGADEAKILVDMIY